MSPDELYECMILNEHSTVMQIIADDYSKTDALLETFMGVKVDTRREYYNNHYNDVEIFIE